MLEVKQGQQLLLGAYSSLQKEASKGKKIKIHTRCELVDVVTIDGRARGIITRDIVSGAFKVRS